MSETTVRRRGHGEDGIHLDAARNRYVGAISLGYGPDGKRIRRKVSGKTKQEVRAKLQALHQELNSGVRSSSTYTVREAVDDWLREGLDGTSGRTRSLYEGLLGPVLDVIGARPLRVLSAGDVRIGSQRARHALFHPVSADHPELAGAGDPARRVQRPGRSQRGGALVKTPQGRSGWSVEELHAGSGEGSAGRVGRYAPARVRGAEPAGRHPHRGGPGAALGPRGDLGG